MTNFFADCGTFRPSQDGNTALHIAAKLGNTEAIKALLSAGANPSIMNVVSIYMTQHMYTFSCVHIMLVYVHGRYDFLCIVTAIYLITH